MVVINDLADQVLGAINGETNRRPAEQVAAAQVTRDGTDDTTQAVAPVTTTRQLKPDGTYFDILNPGKAPGILGPNEEPRPNAEATAFDFANGEIQVTLPSVAEVTASESTGDACLDGCQSRMRARMENCRVLRQRVELMLKRAGCPSKVIGDYSSHNPCGMPKKRPCPFSEQAHSGCNTCG